MLPQKSARGWQASGVHKREDHVADYQSGDMDSRVGDTSTGQGAVPMTPADVATTDWRQNRCPHAPKRNHHEVTDGSTPADLRIPVDRWPSGTSTPMPRTPSEAVVSQPANELVEAICDANFKLEGGTVRSVADIRARNERAKKTNTYQALFRSSPGEVGSQSALPALNNATAMARTGHDGNAGQIISKVTHVIHDTHELSDCERSSQESFAGKLRLEDLAQMARVAVSTCQGSAPMTPADVATTYWRQAHCPHAPRRDLNEASGRSTPADLRTPDQWPSGTHTPMPKTPGEAASSQPTNKLVQAIYDAKFKMEGGAVRSVADIRARNPRTNRTTPSQALFRSSPGEIGSQSSLSASINANERTHTDQEADEDVQFVSEGTHMVQHTHEFSNGVGPYPKPMAHVIQQPYDWPCDGNLRMENHVIMTREDDAACQKSPPMTPADVATTYWRQVHCPQTPRRDLHEISGRSTPADLRTPVDQWPSGTNTPMPKTPSEKANAHPAGKLIEAICDAKFKMEGGTVGSVTEIRARHTRINKTKKTQAIFRSSPGVVESTIAISAVQCGTVNEDDEAEEKSVQFVSEGSYIAHDVHGYSNQPDASLGEPSFVMLASPCHCHGASIARIVSGESLGTTLLTQLCHAIFKFDVDSGSWRRASHQLGWRLLGLFKAPMKLLAAWFGKT